MVAFFSTLPQHIGFIVLCATIRLSSSLVVVAL